MSANKLLSDAAARAVRYVSAIGDRRVAPTPADLERLAELAGPLNEDPCDPSQVLSLLDEIGSPATVASTGGRYFGFVTGGALPASMAANWLAGAWDQNAALFAQSPVATTVEEIAAGWLREIFGFPPACGVSFTTGATMANFTALAAARHALLARAGWNVEDRGLFGAPEIEVIVGGEVHVSLLKALSMLGFGRTRVTTVPADDQGRMRAGLLPRLTDRTLICIQAGNVNSGAFDPALEICAKAREAGAWVHVDGAFGLWAAAAPARAHLMNGFAGCDSWATDGHKWLNVPYDSGFAFVRDADHLRAAMTLSAAYLQMGNTREPALYTPEASRRARGIEVWAALRSLGRRGLAEMIESNCRMAARFADGFRSAGFAVLNEVMLNQVLVSFGEAAKTRSVIQQVQNEGTCWCGGTEWHGQTAMRISVSSWATTEADVDRSLCAILQIANRRNVVVIDYDPAWVQAFEALREKIWPAVQDVAIGIEHVGSTSVAGLAAKPVIDLYVIVPLPEDVPAAIERLQPLGYQHLGDLGIVGREAFRAQSDIPAHNLYVCHRDSPPLQDVVAFRDYLRKHPDAAREYGELKRSLAAQFPYDIDSYVKGKTDLVLGILEQAGIPQLRRDEIRRQN